MSATEKSCFLVNVAKDSVFILIQGKATFLNASTFKQFIDNALDKKQYHFVIDFENCTGMDSTFLGIIAYLGLQIKSIKVPSVLIVRNLNKRNNELFHNLGLHNFITTEDSLLTEGAEPNEFTELEEAKKFEAIDVLKAHQNLVLASKNNASIFKDVINILENKLAQD